MEQVIALYFVCHFSFVPFESRGPNYQEHKSTTWVDKPYLHASGLSQVRNCLSPNVQLTFEHAACSPGYCYPNLIGRRQKIMLPLFPGARQQTFPSGLWRTLADNTFSHVPVRLCHAPVNPTLDMQAMPHSRTKRRQQYLAVWTVGRQHYCSVHSEKSGANLRRVVTTDRALE